MPAALLLSALPPPAAAQAGINNPGAFVYGIIGDIDSLDPHWQYDGISHLAMYQLYETLVFYKGPSVAEFEPLLAGVVPSKANGLVSKDGLAYTFPLRKGVRFHNGAPFGPEDAKYSLMRFLLLDRIGGPSELLLEPILGVHSTREEDGKLRTGLYDEADRAIRVEGGALVIRLKKPFSPFLSILAGFCPMVSKSWTAAHGGWDGAKESWPKLNGLPKEASCLHDRANGTGPFMLERWDQKQKQLVLLRNPGYWREPARLERLVFKTAEEFSTRKLLLAGGDMDSIFVERQFLPQLAGVEGIVVEDDIPFLEVHNAFVFNFKINPEANPYVGSGKLDGNGIPADFFADANVRKGFGHAFDYEAYIKDGYRGKGTRARGPIPKGVPGHNPNQPVLAFNPALAAEHLKKAFGGRVWEKGLRLGIAYMQGRADRQLACQILKNGIESLNPKFKVDAHGVQWSTLLAMSNQRKVPLMNARWGLDYPDPHNCVHPFLHSHGNYAERSGYRSPRADRLIEEAVSELDPDKRRALYHELQALAAYDLPALFTIDTSYVRVRRAWVKGWEYNPIVLYGYFYPVYKDGAI